MHIFLISTIPGDITWRWDIYDYWTVRQGGTCVTIILTALTPPEEKVFPVNSPDLYSSPSWLETSKQLDNLRFSYTDQVPMHH